GSLFAVLVTLGLVGTMPRATALETTWQRRVGEAANAVAVAPDGSVYVAAQRRVSISVGAVLRKYTPGGSLVWSRTWVPTPSTASTRGEVVAVAENGTIVWGGELHGSCEGGGWFLEWRAPGGRLLHRYKTPDWRCGRAERIMDISARDGQVVVAGYSHGCCGDPFDDGWIRAFGMDGRPTWETDIEPPAGTPSAWFDTATGVAVGGLGSIYVSGWAATERITFDPGKGTPILVKLTSGGGLLWSRRAPVKLFQFVTPIAVAARGDQIVVSAGAGGQFIGWGSGSAPSGWLGSFDAGGSLHWSVRWDDGHRQGAQPADVAIDASGTTWVIGRRRDLSDRGYDAFVRRYGPGGGVRGVLRFDGPREMAGTGVAIGPGGAYATGLIGTASYDAHGGRVWRLAA
ncbi:MAG: hypothetical protein WD096_08075, partial [Actinomycetota bacterium]